MRPAWIHPCAALLALAIACSGGSDEPAPPVPLTLTGETTTLAGTGGAGHQDSTDGTGATAIFNFPRGLTTDGSVLYLSESTGRRIRAIVPSTGATTTLAGNGAGIFQDSTDGTGATASFVEPRQIVHLGGYLYVADIGAHRIRRVRIGTGETSTLAGDGTPAEQDSTDGTGATARFNAPGGIATDGTWLYVCDRDGFAVRRVHPMSGATTTLAGNGVNADQESTDGTGATAGFASPFVLAAIGQHLYVGNGSRVLRVHKVTGATAFLAGAGAAGFQDSTDGTGATARFSNILGLGSDGVFLYVGDSGNQRVRRVVPDTGETTTVAGDGTAAHQDSTDGTGATARFSSPRGSAALGGRLYVADGGNHRVRIVD